MKPITNLSTIISNYDALLLDLWGVVHDGSQLYPGVHETLTQLRKDGKKVIMLSNAPRRAAKAAKVLTMLGVEPALYDHVLTSGEMGYQWLDSLPHRGRARVGAGLGDANLNSQQGSPPPNLPPAGGGTGERYFYIGPSKDADVLSGLDYRRADDIKQADFLLNVGFGDDGESADDWQPILRAGKMQKLPMLCLNPDFEVVKISGERFACAGVLAADYERMGGEVKYFGKPFAEVYERCMELLFPSPSQGEGRVGVTVSSESAANPHPNLPPKRGKEKSRVLAVGDGIATDIAGAVNFGLDAALVTGGIIKKESPQAVEALCRKHNAMPKYVMPQLAW